MVERYHSREPPGGRPVVRSARNLGNGRTHEQGYAVARGIVGKGAGEGLDPSRLAVAGDSVGGNMSTALAIMAQQRGDVRFVQQSLYYPVTDAAQNTGSYEEFADGPFLTGKSMAWFWDAYPPERDKRLEITASPLRAPLEDLAGLPPAFVIVDENDVLRDEGEAYAHRLIEAGVPATIVRYDAIMHDFMRLNRPRDPGVDGRRRAGDRGPSQGARHGAGPSLTLERGRPVPGRPRN
jgi:acetyl esterase